MPLFDIVNSLNPTRRPPPTGPAAACLIIAICGAKLARRAHASPSTTRHLRAPGGVPKPQNADFIAILKHFEKNRIGIAHHGYHLHSWLIRRGSHIRKISEPVAKRAYAAHYVARGHWIFCGNGLMDVVELREASRAVRDLHFVRRSKMA
jgi:hypothetical protein